MMYETAMCWLIPLTVGVLCALLGFFWGSANGTPRRKSRTVEREKYDALKEENFHLKQDLELVQSRARELESRLSEQEKQVPRRRTRNSRTPIERKAEAPPFDAAFALKEYGKRVKENDLKIVEGIGPKIEELFNESGIRSWKQLSEATVDQLREILLSGGERFRMHDPTSWPNQAAMAYEQKWKELATWQEASKAGKYSSPDVPRAD